MLLQTRENFSLWPYPSPTPPLNQVTSMQFQSIWFYNLLNHKNASLLDWNKLKGEDQQKSIFAEGLR